MFSSEIHPQMGIPFRKFVFPNTEYSIPPDDELRPPDTITCFFHYTDADGCLGILSTENKSAAHYELWASHLNFLNDKAEYNDGLRIIKSLVESHEEINNIQNPTIKEVVEKFKDSLDVSEKLLPGVKRDIYVICFSTNNDILTQWKYYGKNCGFAIGFNLKNCAYSGIVAGYDKPILIGFGPYKVIYKDSVKKRIIKKMLDESIEIFKKLKNNPDQERSFQNSLERLYSLCPLFKHKDFSDEKECRLIFRPSFFPKSNPPTLLNYRIREGVLIPYIKIKLYANDIQDPIINSITIGPGNNQELVRKSLEHHIANTTNGSAVPKILKSSTPFRG